jgi:spore coat polysaccharide biosynthesis protein SpsF (cytidylyltransferase family)
VVKRSLNANFIPIVCTSSENSDNEIEAYCKINKVKYYRGPLNNKLQRWFECATSFEVEYFHTIDVDDPFFDPFQVSESLGLLKSQQLDVVYPTEKSSSGGASVGYSIRTNYLKHVLQDSQYLTNAEMVDVIFDNFAGTKSKVLVSSASEIDSVRLTLDYEEDYWLLATILRICGEDCTRGEIIKLFMENPDLYKVNWFRNSDWANKQSLSRMNSRDGRDADD